MEESLEEKYRRLQDEIQRAILRNYQNPERRGCPGDATVRNFAANPDAIKVEYETDEHCAWYHVTHCSPCYATFLELREAGRHRQVVSPQGDGRDDPQRRGWRRWLDWISLRRQSSGKRTGF